MIKKVVFNDNITYEPINQEKINMFKKFNIEYIGRDCKSEADFIKYAKEANIIYDQGFTEITKKVLENLPKLEAIVIRRITYNDIDYKAAAELGICVSNTPGFCADEVSTHIVALLLSFIRNIPKNHNLIQRRGWNKNKLEQVSVGIETILGENIGIIGFGNIGKMLAEKLNPFKAYIFVYDPYAEINEKKYNVKNMSLNWIIKECKYIIIICPLTDETMNMFDEEQFRLMRKDAVIINAGRGKLINEKVLIKYLNDNKIVGAALDVFEEEPINKDNPLLKMDNVILSPHIAWVSPKVKPLSFKMGFEEIIRIATGKKPMYRIN